MVKIYEMRMVVDLEKKIKQTKTKNTNYKM